jgi:hypothetical protein
MKLVFQADGKSVQWAYDFFVAHEVLIQFRSFGHSCVEEIFV